MAIGRMYNHFTIAVTTVLNSGMIGTTWLSKTAFEWLQTLKNDFGWGPPLQVQLLPMFEY